MVQILITKEKMIGEYNVPQTLFLDVLTNCHVEVHKRFKTHNYPHLEKVTLKL